jgi:hypothetical protein
VPLIVCIGMIYAQRQNDMAKLNTVDFRRNAVTLICDFLKRG